MNRARKEEISVAVDKVLSMLGDVDLLDMAELTRQIAERGRGALSPPFVPIVEPGRFSPASGYLYAVLATYRDGVVERSHSMVTRYHRRRSNALIEVLADLIDDVSEFDCVSRARFKSEFQECSNLKG